MSLLQGSKCYGGEWWYGNTWNLLASWVSSSFYCSSPRHPSQCKLHLPEDLRDTPVQELSPATKESFGSDKDGRGWSWALNRRHKAGTQATCFCCRSQRLTLTLTQQKEMTEEIWGNGSRFGLGAADPTIFLVLVLRKLTRKGSLLDLLLGESHEWSLVVVLATVNSNSLVTGRKLS